MSRSSRAFGLSIGTATILCLMGLSPQAGPDPDAKKPAAKPGLTPAEAVAAIKPLPLEPIPDNPPPHEGALFRLPYRIQSPDLVLVEVLEALPGRPITGERLVSPDGTISLGFYGVVNVAGLTVTQAQVKICHHLRHHLTDQSLGLVRFTGPGIEPGPLPAPGTRVDDPAFILTPDPEPDVAAKAEVAKVPFKLDINVKLKRPFELDIHVNEPIPAVKPPDGPIAPPPGVPHAGEPKAPVAAPPGKEIAKPEQVKVKGAPPPARQAEPEEHYVSVDPVESTRVFVDVTAYNSGVYYVLGLVGYPGRLPITGNETVLDAIQYAGGLIPSVDEKGVVHPIDVVLHRPARGEAPARKYIIDIGAMHRGETKANLQIFHGDRILVGRRVEPKPADTQQKK